MTRGHPGGLFSNKDAYGVIKYLSASWQLHILNINVVWDFSNIEEFLNGQTE